MMYKWKVSLFVFFLVGTLGVAFLPASPAHATCPDGMTSYWKLDETTPGTYVDTFNGNDGAGAADPAAVAGQVNGAQEFDGTNMGIDVQADKSFGWYKEDSFSIEFWIKRDGAVTGTNQVAIGRNEGDPDTSLHWFVGIEGGSSNKAIFSLGDNNGGDITDVVGDTTITNDAWHHVVAVRDGAAGQNLLYVDGVLDATAVDKVYTAGFDSATAVLNMGWLDYLGGYRLGGMLDEVALYDRALTADVIQDHYEDGLAGRDYCLGSIPPSDAPYPEDTISYWKLDETTPGTYVDTFNGNDGAGAADPAAVAGQVNGAQEFDGTNMGIDVQADKSFGWYKEDSFSIEFWIKRDGAVTGTNQVAIGRNEGDPDTSLHWFVGIEGGSSNKAIFSLGDNNGGDITDVVGDTTITNDAWHHVVAVRDGAAGQNLLYVDGVLDATAVDKVYTAGFDSATAVLNMGWLDYLGGYRLGGMLDEVALYDRALTADEIQDHYEDGLEGWGIGYIPVAGFTANPISGVRPLIVNFTDESTGNITSWSWDFGDGLGSSTEQSPTYTYDNAGTYPVILTVTGPNGTDTETKNDYIVVGDIAPVANFTADPMSGAYPLTVEFTDQSTGNITSWFWDFGDGSTSTSTEQNPIYIYNNAGTYTVSLTVTSSGRSHTEIKTDYITVSKPKGGGGGGGGCFINTMAR